MKLVYFINDRIPTEKAYGWGVSKLCEQFSDLGKEVLLVLPRSKNKIKQSIFDYYSVKENFKIRRIANINLVAHFKYFHKLLFLIQNFSFLLSSFFIKTKKDDLIYLRNIEGLLFWPRRNKNVFFEIHFLSKKDRFFLFLVKRARGVIVVTQKLKDTLIEYGIAPEKILVAPDAVDLEEFSIKQSREECRLKLNLPPDKKIVMYTGHLYDWKGATVLLEAAQQFSMLNDQFSKNLLFVFVGGTDEDIKKFKAQSSKLKNVVIVGHRQHKEMPFWLKSADVLVLPNSGKENISKYWTSPIKMFEYMAAQKPIVASDLPSIREILDDPSTGSGKGNAVLVEPDNQKALADGIKRALEDKELADKISKQAYSDVKNYTWKKRAEGIINFINKNKH